MPAIDSMAFSKYIFIRFSSDRYLRVRVSEQIKIGSKSGSVIKKNTAGVISKMAENVENGSHFENPDVVDRDQWLKNIFCGSNSVVECQLPKLNVAGSIPVSRSKNGKFQIVNCKLR